jgi:hypothetical protein
MSHIEIAKLARVSLIACLASPLVAQQPPFEATQQSFGTGLFASGQGYYPQGHVLADFDGDGDLDVVIADIGDWIAPRFTLMKNRGDGTFEAPVFVAMSGESADVVTADLDGDGDPDLAFCIGEYGTQGASVGVFFNNGDATFGAQQTFACGQGPTGIVAFDADRDGDIDLATANWYWNESDVSVLYNNGAGSFLTRADFPIAGAQPYKLAAGDLDGDAWPDLAVSVATSTAAVALLRNDHTGHFAVPTSLPPSSSASVNGVPGVSLADVDNDGDLDVLYASGDLVGPWGSIGLYRNNGNGTFAALESLAVTVAGAHDFAVADVTGDGWPDILCVGYGNKYGYSLLRGNGSGGFVAEQNFRTGEMARSISVGDIDNDGDKDVVVANSGSNTITVHENEGGAFSMPYSVPTAAFCNGIASGDIDGDGDRDVVTTDTRIWSLFNDGVGQLTPSIQNANFGALNAPKLRDIDGDGFVDLLARASGVVVALNEGNAFPGFFQPFSALSTGSVTDFDVLDADGDGDLDVVGTVNGSNSDRIVLVLNAGNGTFGAPSFFGSWSVTGGGTIVTGDFDNDGDQDVVYGNADAVAWLNSGLGLFGAPIVSPAAGGFVRMIKGDFNGDGKLDVAGVNYDWNGAGENLVVLLGLGNGHFAAPATYYGMFSIQYGGTTTLAALDADQDGDLDIVCGAYGADDVVLFRNNGGGIFGAPVGYGTSGAVTALHVADLDNDGLPEVLANIGTEPPLGGAVQVLFGRSATTLPTAYCTAGTSSSGCVPAIASTGIPSATTTTPFSIHVSNVEGQRPGLIFYGVSGRNGGAWGPSTSFLCVKAPMQRTGAHNAGGNLFQCDGSLSLDWNAFVAANPTALGAPFHVGQVIDAQGWYRDPASAKTTSLSNGLEFALQP